MPNPKRPKLTMLQPRVPVLGSIVEEKLRLGTVRQHKAHKPDTTKTNAQQRARRAKRYLSYSSAAWQSIRRAQLERFPTCKHCGDAATDVDHIFGDTSANIIGVDLQSLCHACHSVKTQADQYYQRTGKRQPIKGCDVDGWPRDPWHHWNAGRVAEKSPADDGRKTACPAKHARPRIGGG